MSVHPALLPAPSAAPSFKRHSVANDAVRRITGGAEVLTNAGCGKFFRYENTRSSSAKLALCGGDKSLLYENGERLGAFTRGMEWNKILDDELSYNFSFGQNKLSLIPIMSCILKKKRIDSYYIEDVKVDGLGNDSGISPISGFTN
ncbi:hypothetical protein SDJN03_14035, partial [Cucurbita argyrosperma subsp. sororia]